jgi:type I restriction enzyme S subunit
MTDWPIKSLGEVCDFVRGVTYDKADARSAMKNGFIPLLRATNITEKGLLREDFVFVPSDGVRADQKLISGDALITIASGSASVVGRSVLVEDPGEMTFGAFCGVLRPGPGILPKYLSHFMSSRSVRTAWSEAAQGTNINNLKRDDILQTECLLPPLEEQKRIVALLDAATARVDECQEVTQAELRLASDLYQARIEELLSAHALRGVREVELATVIDLVIDHRGKTPNKLGGDFTDSGVPVVSAIHIKDDSIKWSERYRYVTHEMFERWMPERLMKGDILLTSEAPLGQVARIESDEPLVLSQRLFALRAKGSLVSGDFLFEFLRSPLGQDRLKARATGATAVGIRQAELMKVMVPVPRLEDQPKMIHQIHAARQNVLKLQSQLRGRELLLKDLRQSILEAAFIGEL